MTMRSAALASLLLLAVTPAGVASAAPLDAPACDQLRQEMGAIEKTGAMINLAKGPAWAKANLKPDQLQQIERLLDLQSQFLFRCPQPKRQFDAATEAILENGTGSDPDLDAQKAAAVSTEPGAKPVPARKAARPKQAAVAPEAAETGAAPAAVPATLPPARTKRPARPKPTDAFVPEPGAKPDTAPAAGAAPQ